MRPEDVGLARTTLVLGKHSGRHAFRDRVKQLGFELDDIEFNRVFEEFKALADKKKELFDGDIEALVLRAEGSASGPWTLAGLKTVADSANPAAEATVRLEHCGRPLRWRRTVTGDGPVDAAFKAIEAATGINVALRKFEVRGVTEGEDAQGEAIVYVEYNQRTYRGSSVSTNIVESSSKAFLEVINRIELAIKTGGRARDERTGAAARRAAQAAVYRNFHAHSCYTVHLVQRQARSVGESHGSRDLPCPALRARPYSKAFARTRRKTGVAIFRLRDHTRRLFDSAKIYRINVPFSQEQISEACRQVVAVNNSDARRVHLRPIVFKGYGEIGVSPKNEPPTEVAIAAWEWGKYLGDDAAKNRAWTCASRPGSAWRRTRFRRWPRPRATTFRASSSVRKRVGSGFAEGIGLSPDGTVSEGAGENLFLIKDGVLLTPGPRPLRPGRHHARLRDPPGARARARGERDVDPARAALHRGRALHDRHGRRDHADPFGGPPGCWKRQARPHHRIAAGGVLRPVLRQDAGQVGLAGPGRHECAASRRRHLIALIRGNDSTEDDVREGLGAAPRCSPDPRHARCTVHRPAPHS